MRILYVTTIGGTMCFFKSLIKELVDAGHTVDIACNDTASSVPSCYNEWGCKTYRISCSREPISNGNAKAVKEIHFIVESGNYDIVHCHTPVAAACTRCACRGLRKSGLKVLYTTHGLHFFKGGPKTGWLFFYPVEKICARWTDVLITINEEDYELAKKRLKAKATYRIPGVGLDVERFQLDGFDRDSYRKDLGLVDTDYMVLSVGELNDNKNHQLVMRSIAAMEDESVHYFIAGVGPNREKLEDLASTLGLRNRVHFLGYRENIAQLNHAADVFAFPSLREGLGMAALEALASGTPVCGMDTRGIREYVVDGETGYLFNNDIDRCKEALVRARGKKLDMGNACRLMASAFSSTRADEAMRAIYGRLA